MAGWSKYQDFRERLGKGEFNLATDTLKIALSNTAPDLAAEAVFADITEIAAGNGYTAGGFALAGKTYTETGGVGMLDANDLVITASGGTMGDFRYVILFDDTAAGKPLIQVGDLGSVISLGDGESYTLEWNASGILTID